MSVDDNLEAINKTLKSQKLDRLRTSSEGKGWQQKFGLSEAIPVTVVVANGRVRVVHDAVLPDAVAYLEADLSALQGIGESRVGVQKTDANPGHQP